MAQTIKNLNNLDLPTSTEQLQQELTLLRQRLQHVEGKLNQQEKTETELYHVTQILQQKVATEKLVSSILHSFATLPPQDIDQGIHYTLKTIGEFATVDRSYLILYTNRQISHTYQWYAPGIDPQLHYLPKLTPDHVDWMIEQTQTSEYTQIPHITHLPTNMDSEKENNGWQNVKSFIIIPLLHQEALKGFLGFDSIQVNKVWTQEDISLFKTASEILLNILERHSQMEYEKTAYNWGQKFASLLDISSLLIFAINQLKETFNYHQVQIYLSSSFPFANNPQSIDESFLIVYNPISNAHDLNKNHPHTTPPQPPPLSVMQAAHLLKPIIVNDTHQHPNHYPLHVLSEIAIPLISEQKPIGVLHIQHTVVNYFTSNETHILQIIANQLSNALGQASLFEQNQKLLNETNRRAKELTVLHAITKISASSTHEDELIEHTTTIIGEALYPTNFCVLLLDKATGSLQTHRSYRGKNVPVTIGQGVVGRVAASGEPWLIPDVSQEPAYIAVDIYTRSELCVPLKIGEEVIGVLNTENTQPNAYTKADERLLTIIAQQLATGIHKIRLFADVIQSLNREQGLSDIIRTLNTAPDMPSILASVVRMATELIKADAGLLGLLIDQQILSFYPYNLPHHVSLRPLPKGHGIAWQIVETGEAFLLTNYADHSQAEHKWIRAGVKASIAVPIVAAESVLGTLELFYFTPDKQFNHRDLKLAESIGRQAGIVLQNRRLYAEAQQRASMLATTLSKQEELDRSKNVFIQNVSHELRTPLGIVYGHAELLESGGLGELSSEQFQSVQIIVRRARMLTDLLDDLSALLAAETQEFRRDPIEPSQLIQSVLTEFQVKAKESQLLLHADIEKNLPWIMGDPMHLRRVFDNLLANAFKFTSPGGTIMVKMIAEGKDLVIEVADTGRGIPEEKLGRIFERFFQVQDEPKHRKQGTGLGLALVKEIVEAHRGQVSVQSVLGQGTTFQIWLPGQEPPPPIE